jgi:hypothetical protein
MLSYIKRVSEPLAAVARVPLMVYQGSYVESDDSAALLKQIGGGDRVRSMCAR